MKSAMVPLQAIAVGERDREEMGDIDALAESINAVGLLHPLVVTESLTLVAGGRRLEALGNLGWTQAPVTIVDLSNVADVLRAEADENTQRKPLTPYEAARARERRARALAEDAAKRKAATQPKAGEQVGKTDNAGSAKLAEPEPRHERETRKAAATGTGYSGSTLDKVDKIRDAAERGVVRQGKEEIPVPEQVREVARRELENVKQTGAAVEPAHRAVADAIDTYLGESPDVQRATLRRNVFRAIAATQKALPAFDAAAVADVCDEELWESIQHAEQMLRDWVGQVDKARPKGLRLVGGAN